MGPRYWSGVIIVAFIQGSSINFIKDGSGKLDGLIPAQKKN